MKWAPNKKLHFEVAIIKAIQSLNQATLDEVIEKLGELRDGKAPAEKKTLVAEKSSPPSTSSVTAAVSAAPQKTPPEPVAPTTPQAAESANGETDLEKIWQSVYAMIPNTKAFVRNSAAAAHVVGAEGRHFILGFSPDEKSTMEILGTVTNRKLIESLLAQVTGRDWTLKLTVQENLPPKQLDRNRFENCADDPLIKEALEIFKGEIKR